MSDENERARPRTNVYIDGFNLYHGCFDDRRNLAERAHWRQYRWLDLGTFCDAYFERNTINHIRYFTALVDPFEDNPDNRARQLIYLRALATIPHLTIHHGRFATNVKDRPLADPTSRKPKAIQPRQMARIIEREEKGSDVNLASHLILDGCKRDYEVAIVVSNDADLAEPIRLSGSVDILRGFCRPRFAGSVEWPGADVVK